MPMWRTALLWVVLVGLAVAQIQDSTRQAGAAGPQVVDAVISLIRESCLFPDDRQMLRRLAFMLTNDGQDPDTYRSGFHGGIWAVPEAEFQATKNDPRLQHHYQELSSRFGITWNNLQWSELRKPLFSGLAAALYLVQTLGDQVPVSLERQAAWYQKVYFPNDPMAAYNFTKEADNILNGCSSSNLDLAFLVDSSSSLRPVDFTDALTFAADVVDKFAIGPNDVQVALLTFGTGFKTEFDFNDHSTKAEVQAAIRAVQYQPGQTDTDQALDFAASSLFVPGGTAGARLSSAKVAVLVTDGKATHSTDAVMKAQELRQKGVTIFVIGVGSEVDVNELNSLATEPYCTHVQLLKDYRDLESLKAEIQRLSCRAPVILTEGNYSFPCDSVSNFRISINGNETITIRSANGFVDIYGSFLNPYPNTAFSEFKTVATSVREAIIYVKDESRPLYLSIVSKGSDPALCKAGNQYSVTVQNKNAIRADALITCYENGIVRQCTPLDILSAIYNVLPPVSLGFPNPCQPNHPGYFPHPLAYDRFIYCDSQGVAYLVFCPQNFWYSDNARNCVPGTPPTVIAITTPAATTRPPLVMVTTSQPNYVTSQPGGNPCTKAALDRGDRFFPHPTDPLKYIVCTEWPNYGVIKDCAPLHRWSQHDLSCIYYQTVVDPTKNVYLTTPSPIAVNCQPGLTDQSLFYHPYPGDNTKFIQCDQFGDAFVMSCPESRIWNQHFLTCTPNSIIG